MKIVTISLLLISAVPLRCNNDLNTTNMDNDLDIVRDEFLSAVKETSNDRLILLKNAEGIPAAQYDHSRRWMERSLEPTINPYHAAEGAVKFEVALSRDGQPYDLISFSNPLPQPHRIFESSSYIVIISSIAHNSPNELVKRINKRMNLLFGPGSLKPMEHIGSTLHGELFSTAAELTMNDLTDWTDRVDVVHDGELAYAILHKVDPDGEFGHPSRWFKDYFRQKHQ